ncbi:DNA mismatch repair protein MutL [Galdieria sulphuraria]|nr:DNA mismatch repair protein MutL [Galdieria sulphuraria]
MAVQRRLSQDTVHLLCASLEFHRPSIILDKLLYCSLQSYATWIRVTVKQRDFGLILEDNGIGIELNELESLRTSSLYDSAAMLLEGQLSENFTNILRLLSCICDITVISRKKNQDKSQILKIKKGKVTEASSFLHFSRYGNKITLTNLFYSLPVRQQWLRRNRKQLYHVVNGAILRFAAMFPKCDFELHTEDFSTSGALIRIFRKTGGWKSRLKALWGTETTSHLASLQLETSYGNVTWTVNGFFSSQRSTRLSREYSQIVFLNDRPCHLNLQKQISDLLIKASQENLETVTTRSDRKLPGEPSFYIHLYVKKEKVHYDTLEYLEAQILKVLEEAFHASFLHINSSLNTTLATEEGVSRLRVTADYQVDKNFELLPKNLYSPWPQCTKLSMSSTTSMVPQRTISETMRNLQEYISSPSVYSPIGRGSFRLTDSKVKNNVSTTVSRATFQKMVYKGVWNRSFILFWAEETLYAMDQHAADERVQYENLQYQLLELVNKSSIPTKALNEVEPEMYLQLNVEEYECAYRYMDRLLQWGWRLSFESISPYDKAPRIRILEMPFLPDMLTIHADILREQIQSMVVAKSPNVIFQQIPQAILQELATKACQKAIKFGDYLTYQQISQLLEQLKECKYPFQCAHGRPSIVPLFQVSN